MREAARKKRLGWLLIGRSVEGVGLEIRRLRVVGYSQALVQAHEHAHMGGLEIEMLESLLLQQVAERDPAVARTARQLRLLGRQLVEAMEDDEQHEH